jgi:glycosyltransferase involved in cell wall biosynthesis
MSGTRTLLQVLPDVPLASSGLGWVAEGVATAMRGRGWRVERVSGADLAPKRRGRTYFAVPFGLAHRAHRAAQKLSLDGPCLVECHGFWGGLATASFRVRPISNVATLFRCHGFWRAAVALAAADDSGSAHPSPLRTFKSELTYGSMERLGVRLSDAVVVQNSADAKFAELVDGVPLTRLCILAPGIAAPSFQQPAPRAGPLRALWVGRRSLVKGSDFLPEIARQLHEHGTPVQLELVGHDARSFDSLPNVLVRAPMSRADVAESMSRADVFLWTSRYEGFGLAPFEAMAYGVPVISSRVGGMVDLLRDGENGLAVNDPSSAAFVDAIRRFATLDVGSRERLRSESQRSVAHLTWERHVEQLERFVEPFFSARSST